MAWYGYDPRRASPKERRARMLQLLGPVWRHVDPPYGDEQILTKLPKRPIFVDPQTGEISDWLLFRRG